MSRRTCRVRGGRRTTIARSPAARDCADLDDHPNDGHIRNPPFRDAGSHCFSGPNSLDYPLPRLPEGVCSECCRSAAKMKSALTPAHERRCLHEAVSRFGARVAAANVMATHDRGAAARRSARLASRAADRAHGPVAPHRARRRRAGRYDARSQPDRGRRAAACRGMAGSCGDCWLRSLSIDLPNDVDETDIPVPSLPNKHDGSIEFHFLPDRKIEAKWVEYPTDPRNPNTTSNASPATN